MCVCVCIKFQKSIRHRGVSPENGCSFEWTIPLNAIMAAKRSCVYLLCFPFNRPVQASLSFACTALRGDTGLEKKRKRRNWVNSLPRYLCVFFFSLLFIFSFRSLPLLVPIDAVAALGTTSVDIFQSYSIIALWLLLSYGAGQREYKLRSYCVPLVASVSKAHYSTLALPSSSHSLILHDAAAAAAPTCLLGRKVFIR